MNNMKSVKILDIPIQALTETMLIDIINGQIEKSRLWDKASKPMIPITIFKPYVEYFNFKRWDKAKKLLLSGDIIIADSIALIWASWCLEHRAGQIKSWIKALTLPISPIRDAPLPQRFNGIDITIKILEMARDNNYSVAIVGGPRANTNANRLKSHQSFLRNRFKNINIVMYDGYTHFKDQNKIKNLFDNIKSSNTDILMIAMGFPLQEEYALMAKENKIAPVIITEGGSFDYEALGGNIKRAPRYIQGLGLEWLFRLLIDPKRLYRQLFIIQFINTIAKNSKR